MFGLEEIKHINNGYNFVTDLESPSYKNWIKQVSENKIKWFKDHKDFYK